MSKPMCIVVALLIFLAGCHSQGRHLSAKSSDAQAHDSAPTAKPLPAGCEMTVADAYTTKQSQRIAKAWLPILRPGQSTGELKPVIDDGTPQSGDIFIMVDVSFDFPGSEIRVDLKRDLFLVDAAGSEKHGAVLTKDVLTDAKGNRYVGFWHLPSQKVRVQKEDPRLSLLFSVSEDKANGSVIRFLTGDYPLWLKSK